MPEFLNPMTASQWRARRGALARRHFAEAGWPQRSPRLGPGRVTEWQHGEVTTLPRSRPLTRDDLAGMPEDGHRYELIDGTLVVSPSPSWLHQRVVGRLLRLLDDACPTEFEVFVAPLDVVLAEDTVVLPDVLVARRSDLGERDLPSAPVLAVEVRSPNTARVDRWLKWSTYQAAGVGSYWIVDPAEPSLIAWDLVDGEYAEVGRFGPGGTYVARRPYEVRVRPSDLVGD